MTRIKLSSLVFPDFSTGAGLWFQLHQSVSNLFPSIQLIVPNTDLEQKWHAFYSRVENWILEIKLFSGQNRSSTIAKSILKKETEASRWLWWIGEAGEEQTESYSCTCQQVWLQQTWNCMEELSNKSERDKRDSTCRKQHGKKNPTVCRIKRKKTA